eukprot:801393-Heterocapsa_arctica.AAC.1
MILNVAGLTQPAAPTAGQTPMVVFAELRTAFGIDKKVADYFVDAEGLETLHDFCGFFTALDQVEAKLIEK